MQIQQFYDQISRENDRNNKLFQIADENSNELFTIHFAVNRIASLARLRFALKSLKMCERLGRLYCDENT